MKRDPDEENLGDDEEAMDGNKWISLVQRRIRLKAVVWRKRLDETLEFFFQGHNLCVMRVTNLLEMVHDVTHYSCKLVPQDHEGLVCWLRKRVALKLGQTLCAGSHNLAQFANVVNQLVVVNVER